MRMSRMVLRGALGEIPEVYSLQRCRSGTSVGEATRVLILVAAVGTDLVSTELLPIAIVIARQN